MGHSVPREVSGGNGTMKIQKRLELLPEETMYLVERGALFCWKDMDSAAPEADDIQGTPMTVQQVHSEMIGIEGLTLEKYQVPQPFTPETIVFLT
jgi:tRNA-splicing endonuclease subunit Sen54